MCEVMDVLIKWEESFRNGYVYQIVIISYNCICQLYLSKGGEKMLTKERKKLQPILWVNKGK